MNTTGHHDRKVPHPVLVGLFAALALFAYISTANGAPPPPQYTNTCGDCHGTNATDIRPIDTTTFRNVTTGAFAGSHSTHMAATGSPTACDKCHTGASGYATGHMNDQVDMSDNINSSPHASKGKYSKAAGAVFFNRTSNPLPLGSCSNVNCHFEKTTPEWAGTPFNNAATTDCDKCHGAPPAGTAGAPGTAGSHARHDTYYTGPGECTKCHTDHIAESNRFTHATSLRNIVVAPHDPANVAGGTYSGSGANFLPSQSGSQIFGSCSNLYCHSQGKSATTFTGTATSPKTTPTWGGSLPANCEGCHGGTNTASFNAISSGMHQKHINNAAKVGRPVGCEQCHFATTTDGTSVATVGYHVNKSVNIKFAGINGTTPTYDGGATNSATGAAKAPGSGFGGAGCASLYCHSDGNPAAGSRQYRTIKWNAAAIGCNGCHGTGNATSNAYPDHANAGAGAPGSNSHVKHADATNGYSFTCIKCHSGTVADATNVNLQPAGVHLDGSGSVAFDSSVPSNAGGTYTSGTQSCSATYCHSNGNGTSVTTPVWGATAAADCTYCHGNNASSATPISTNKHSAHINNVAVLGTNQNFTCSECHAATVNADRTIANKSRHVNGFKDFSGARAYKTGYSGGSCTSYCHSSGQATPVYRNMTGSKVWSSAAALNCKGCHGYGVKPFAAFTSVAGEPNYASGGAAAATANTHKKHTEARGITDSRGCAACHRLTVDQGVIGKLKNYSSLHLNSQRNINFASYGNVTGHYTVATKTCSNTYCHPSVSIQWGGAPLNCNGCHFANNTLAAAHKIHWETVAVATNYVAAPGNTSGDPTKYQFECSSCHNSSRVPGATHANGPVTAAIQVGEVYFGYTTATRKGSYTAAGISAGQDGTLNYTASNGTSCLTSYCHSNGSNGNGNAAVLWTTAAKTADPLVRCVKCHNYTKATTPITTNGHNRHVNDYVFNCSRCHYATTTNGTSVADSRKHVNKVKDVVWDAAADGGTPYNAPNCTNIYCHSQGTKFTSGYTAADVAPNSAAGWSGTMPADCSGCHDGAATGPAYPDGSPKANSHDKHVQTMKYRCFNCHAGMVGDVAVPTAPAITDKTLHVNKAYNLQAGGAGVSIGSISAGSPGTPSTCTNISCHNGNGSAIAWNAASPGCRACHVNAGGGDTDNFTGYNGTLSLLSNTEWMSKGHGAATSYTSGRPGANFAANATNECLYCHDSAAPHSSTASNFFRLANYSTIAYGRNAPCLVCHGRNASGYLSKSVAFTRISSIHYGAKHAGTGGGYFCWDCHDPHGDANVYMIHDQVAKTSDRSTGKPLTFAAVSFTGFSTGGNYAGASNKICNACHTSASLTHYTASNVNDGHNLDTRCTECHRHNGPSALSAFKESNNCDSCHGYPPVRRNLTKGTDFRKQNQYSSGRFQDYTGGGGAHTIAKHLAPTVKASDGWAPCAVCHSNGSLSPATHTTITPVRPNGSITIDVKDSRKFDYRRSLGQERYTGARLTNDLKINRTGSCSNVNCHFKPSKRWSNSR